MRSMFIWSRLTALYLYTDNNIAYVIYHSVGYSIRASLYRRVDHVRGGLWAQELPVSNKL